MSETAGAEVLPATIGKYRIDAVLGRGAMGVVYRAHDPLIERALALKTVHRRLADPEQAGELLQRFRMEAQAAGRLMHPNIVAVHEYGEDGDLAFIAMEFVDGRPLSSVAGKEACSLPEVLGWMRDLLDALAYAHARGVVHRDIKPANLLVTREGRIKIGDFGIARIESSTLTQTGAMMGTPSYMSPEQFRGEAVDGRSDLFSAGVVLYQLLTGQRPFSGSSATVMQQVLGHTPPAPSQVNGRLAGAIDAVVMRALAKAPEERFPDAGAFHQALVAACDHNDDGDDDDATVMLPPPATGWPGRSLHGTQPAVQLTAWKMDALPGLELLLTRQIGPVARLLLPRIAASAPDFPTLRAELLLQIPSPAAREDFARELDAFEAALAGPATHEPSVLRTAADPDFLAAVTLLLAREIGPIAAIVVRRTAAKVAARLALIERVSEQINAPAARERFLEAGRRLAA